jgi:hypothetical protein
MKSRKAALAVVGAVVLLGSLATAASARNLSVSNLRLRATFASAELSGLFGTTGCALTAEGSFHTRTIAKVVSRLVGYVTSASLGPCRNGSATLLTETLPWHVQYGSFSGSLPNISGVTGKVVNVSFRIRETGGITCLFRSTTAEPATTTLSREAGGAATSVTLGGSIRSGAECLGASSSLGGTSSSLTNETGTRGTITLI